MVVVNSDVGVDVGPVVVILGQCCVYVRKG
jgi:hypothetical protein